VRAVRLTEAALEKPRRLRAALFAFQRLIGQILYGLRARARVTAAENEATSLHLGTPSIGFRLSAT
jgi:hypothetical protein